MDFLGHQKILELKSRCLELFDLDLMDKEHYFIIQKMLSAIQDLFQDVEMTLYTFKEWNNRWSLVASTTDDELIDRNSFNKQMDEISIMQRYTIKDKAILQLPIKNVGHDYFILLLSTKQENPLDLFYSDEFMEKIAIDVASFLKKMFTIQGVIKEKKKYKQLYRVTEKFHSSMKMESVLDEVIYTLQEIYPNFTYYLLLSHDNNSHGDLPVKDLEYDSENMAAMEAYVTAEIQFEELAEENMAVIYAPLKGKQGVYGVLQIIASDTKIFPRNEVEFITILANTAGGALENAQLYQQSKKLVADLQLINEASHQLNSNLRLNEIMTYMCERISSSFEAEEVGFILFSVESNSIKVLQGSSDFFLEPESLNYINYFQDKIQAEKDSLFLGDFSMQLNGAKYKSIMAVPMIQTGILKGFAIVMHPKAYHFSFDTFKLLQSLIHHSTLALTNSMLREELEKMVVTDHLTKLYSRNYLDDKIQRSLIEDEEGTFILMDIDNFKSVNDTYGHQVGDEIIVQVANIIMENIRSSDIGSRWGGEELAIYLPKVPLSIGVSVAERLVKKVRETSTPSVTISCGVSYWNRENGETYNTLFKRADKALYVAKETGKNKVVVQDSYLVSE
ncbi:diguanylate cyclase [Bacillus sp. B1-b2]|uniref:sensor domain-containing diguanylate cyclase n=1 Tax=Bacillus sp. B1-b2 TaxID=2653201 RepID=UPI00126168E8|nr:diguanylate cyclase [Bacillus sp. B1-b2]KAB7666766.1 diguanylate cyclase [Bacillus sp. B1-b2]